MTRLFSASQAEISTYAHRFSTMDFNSFPQLVWLIADGLELHLNFPVCCGDSNRRTVVPGSVSQVVPLIRTAAYIPQRMTDYGP